MVNDTTDEAATQQIRVQPCVALTSHATSRSR
jgi:hypothetical protein